MTLSILLLLLTANVNSKSPFRAVVYSAIFPGGGQFYTEKPLKGGLILLGESYFLYWSVNRYYRMRATWKDYKRERSDDSYRKYQDAMKGFMGELLWFTSIWIYSMVDAYVSAQFYKFDEKTPVFASVFRREDRTVLTLNIRF